MKNLEAKIKDKIKNLETRFIEVKTNVEKFPKSEIYLREKENIATVLLSLTAVEKLINNKKWLFDNL